MPSARTINLTESHNTKSNQLSYLREKWSAKVKARTYNMMETEYLVEDIPAYYRGFWTSWPLNVPWFPYDYKEIMKEVAYLKMFASIPTYSVCHNYCEAKLLF